MTPAPPFNWLTALAGAIEREPNEKEHERLMDLSADWPNCACGQLCDVLPRNSDGAPIDGHLEVLGVCFCVAVLERDWPEALKTFHAIEARTAELLAEKAKQSP